MSKELQNKYLIKDYLIHKFEYQNNKLNYLMEKYGYTLDQAIQLLQSNELDNISSGTSGLDGSAY